MVKRRTGNRLQHSFKYLFHQYEYQGQDWVKIKTTLSQKSLVRLPNADNLP